MLIEYDIARDAWLETASRRHEREVYPTYDLFYAQVTIRIGAEALFERPPHISVADLACGFARVLREGFPTRTREARFSQADDGLVISFERRGDTVMLAADGRTLLTSTAAFTDGALAFLRRFASELQVHISDPFSWKDLCVLARFAPSRPN
jgi:hypothetical protein